MTPPGLKKVAFFVEGLTEMLFIEKLLAEIVTKNKYSMKLQTMRGGTKSIRTVEVIKEIKETDETTCFVLVTECGGDSTVPSYLRENRESLTRSGYSLIVGVVDLYPRDLKDLDKFSKALLLYLPQKPTPTQFVIPVMEIESWFIAEKSHFVRIHPSLTHETIDANLHLDIANIDSTTIDHPAETLDRIYAISGKRYLKKTSSIQRTVDVLDYSSIYFELPDKYPGLKDLVEIINTHIIN